MSEAHADTPDTPGNPDTEESPDSQWLRAKREAVIDTLNGLISAHQIERPELAQKLGWRPARLTRTLSGKENVSIASIAQIVAAVGVDFDVVIRDAGIEATDTPDTPAPDWSDSLQPAGLFIGMTAGIAGIAYAVSVQFTADVLPPMTSALLGAALFMLARSLWKLHLARREIRALKRYLKNRSAA